MGKNKWQPKGKMVQLSDPMEVTLLAIKPIVSKPYRPPPVFSVMNRPKGKCVSETWDDKQRKRITCGAPAHYGAHGWLCADHVKVRKVPKDAAPSPFVNAEDVVVLEARAIERGSGERLSSYPSI